MPTKKEMEMQVWEPQGKLLEAENSRDRLQDEVKRFQVRMVALEDALQIEQGKATEAVLKSSENLMRAKEAEANLQLIVAQEKGNLRQELRQNH